MRERAQRIQTGCLVRLKGPFCQLEQQLLSAFERLAVHLAPHPERLHRDDCVVEVRDADWSDAAFDAQLALDSGKRLLRIEDALDERRVPDCAVRRQAVCWAHLDEVLEAHVGPEHRDGVLDVGIFRGSVLVGLVCRLVKYRTKCRTCGSCRSGVWFSAPSKTGELSVLAASTGAIADATRILRTASRSL